MAWVFLIVAGLLEVVWAYAMKLSYGFTRPVPTLLTFGFMFASFGLLSLSMKTLPLGSAYMVWTGIGAVGAFLVGIVLLGEQVGAMRAVAALLIVTGLVMMRLTTPD